MVLVDFGKFSIVVFISFQIVLMGFKSERLFFKEISVTALHSFMVKNAPIRLGTLPMEKRSQDDLEIIINYTLIFIVWTNLDLVSLAGVLNILSSFLKYLSLMSIKHLKRLLLKKLLLVIYL
jgi:hypothetical protein